MYPLKRFGLLLLLISFQNISSQVIETTLPLVIDESRSSIRTRFAPPKGFYWAKEQPGSFSEFLNNFPLHPPNFPVRDFTGALIGHQQHHIALLKINVGEKNLQQCADAWIRLYAEYLWINQRFDDIGFELTSKQFFSWNDFKNGARTLETGNKVRFVNSGKADDSYENFQKYLEVIFRYAGTISLDRESVPVTNNAAIRTGDFLIKPGSPGHSVIIVGVARNASGKKLYLLAESFMPAQDIHILVNHRNPQLSPWYELDVDAPETVTAKYIFKPTSIKRFHALR
ncbi:DUF4846 domain-containing protein [Chryseobacterium sp. MDT2-18]|uniref:DUF4846 domain-containing protein n=1 Tax=Chryseobacterium sp. MDT2-18 TaxID=1259136 RepID=UPI00278A73D0|nr:DUF4846 domain-containing protein [Chryseobacterium sp. MDT2-18]MDQ0478231.1 hypothetical protein [Chryseobacterium sp. MDT2-18]